MRELENLNAMINRADAAGDTDAVRIFELERSRIFKEESGWIPSAIVRAKAAKDFAAVDLLQGHLDGFNLPPSPNPTTPNTFARIPSVARASAPEALSDCLKLPL